MEKLFDNYWQFLAKREEFGAVPRPVLRWFRSEGLNPVEQAYFDFLQGSELILDYGAGDMALKRKFGKAGFAGRIETCDLSKDFKYDYGSLAEIEATGRKFDAILVLEVIEHMRLEEFSEFLPRILKLLKPRGKFILSTPNAHSLTGVWSADFTHIKSYPLPDLWAMLSLRGFDCQAYRVIMTPPRLGPRGWLRLQFNRALTNLLGADYATGVTLLCQKRE
ncbi:MAG: methyltransferase domain-containing protein [Oligoflexia bacterium]|nr:methyltransferase domain-containing protein [Oligoflexia bacterium]